MQPVNLFDLASQQAQWLSAREAAVAGNIANVNTPGYKAMDVEPFEKVLQRTGVSMVATQKGHFGEAATQASFPVKEDATATATMPSKNSVVLEDQMLKSGEVSRSFELNTAIVKAFHRLMMASMKT